MPIYVKMWINIEGSANRIFNVGLIFCQEIIGGRQVENFYLSIQKIYVFWRGNERER
jgi:hypothetical protein